MWHESVAVKVSASVLDYFSQNFEENHENPQSG
jgi:hypothetical protein